MNNDSKETNGKQSSLVRLYPFVKKYRFWICLSIICGIISAGIGIYVPFLLNKLVEIGMKKDYSQFFGTHFVLLIIVTLFGVIISYLNTISSYRYNTFIMADIRESLINRVKLLPVSFVENNHSGDIISRLVNDSIPISVLIGNIYNIIFQPLIFIFAFIYCFIISWKLLLLTVILLPAAMYINNIVSKPFQKYSNEVQKSISRLTVSSQNYIDNVKTVKSYNLQQIEIKKYRLILDNLFEWLMKLNRRNIFITIISVVLIVIPIMVVNIFGGFLTLNMEIKPAELVVFILLVNYLTGPIAQINGIINSYREAQGAVKRVFSVFDYPIEYMGTEKFSNLDKDIAVKLENVTFKYKEDKNVLNSISFEVKKGQKVALVGRSGCGKTTIFKLLCRFYTYNEGKISVFGNELKDLNIKELRDKISIASQDNYMFPMSIFENIRIGNENATIGEVIEVAKKARAHDFIMNLEDGYNTILGEEGVNLSGGQKQLISISRALLKDFEILLLDESSAALDVENERLVQEAIDDLIEKKTVLIIAHRLSTVKNADYIIVLEDGEIADIGTHDILIKNSKVYNNVYKEQILLEMKQEHGG